MAEFTEIIRLKQRMCKYYHCCDDEHPRCPLDTSGNKKNHFIDDFKPDVSDLECECELIEHLNDERLRWFEKTILNWATEHPEPQYPTWLKWWTDNFGGNGAKMVNPCSFASPRELGCSSLGGECMQAPYKCWYKPIPAHIAEKLGVKPLPEKTDVLFGDTLPDPHSCSHGDVSILKH